MLTDGPSENKNGESNCLVVLVVVYLRRCSTKEDL